MNLTFISQKYDKQLIKNDAFKLKNFTITTFVTLNHCFSINYKKTKFSYFGESQNFNIN